MRRSEGPTRVEPGNVRNAKPKGGRKGLSRARNTNKPRETRYGKKSLKQFNDVEEQKKDAKARREGKKTFSDSMPFSSGDLNLFRVASKLKTPSEVREWKAFRGLN